MSGIKYVKNNDRLEVSLSNYYTCHKCRISDIRSLRCIFIDIYGKLSLQVSLGQGVVPNRSEINNYLVYKAKVVK